MLQNLETKEMMAAKFLSKHWKHKSNTERMKAIILKLFKGNNKRK